MQEYCSKVVKVLAAEVDTNERIVCLPNGRWALCPIPLWDALFEEAESGAAKPGPGRKRREVKKPLGEGRRPRGMIVEIQKLLHGAVPMTSSTIYERLQKGIPGLKKPSLWSVLSLAKKNGILRLQGDRWTLA